MVSTIDYQPFNMLYHLLYPLHTNYFVFNLFKYITFRAAYAGITSLILCFVLGPKLVSWLSRHKFFAGVREKGIPHQESKTRTPTMGGLLMLFTTVSSTLLWANLSESFVWVALFVFLGLGGLGGYDDLRKVRRGKGISGQYKIFWQIAIGICIGLYVFLVPRNPAFRTQTNLLFLKNIFISFGILYIPFVVLVIVSTSNSVNLADGLDGLAIGLIAEVALAYTILAYVVGNTKFSEYLNILYIPGSGELAIFLSAIVGSALGFLWFNANPAEMFMGDSGSLALGGAVGVVAVLIKQEILLVIAGGMFVIEALSVVLQVTYFKHTHGRRLFRMTPLHHHYEKLGTSETKIVVRFWILGILFLLAALSTLKIR